MSPTIIYFVRHAESLHTWKDDRTRPLTEAGLLDRVALLDYFKGIHIDAVYSSPYKRAYDTVAVLAETCQVLVQTDERLRERKAGPDSNNRALFIKRWENLEFAEAQGESIGMVQRRNIECVAELTAGYAGKTIIVGTHGTALASILRYYNQDYGFNDFMRILNWMPYVVKAEYTQSVQISEEFHIEKIYTA